MTDIYAQMTAKYHPVKVQAHILMSNVLYYNGPNRARFLEIEGSTELVLGCISERSDVTIVEASLRSMLSLSYLDTVALWLGGDGAMVPLFLSFLREPYYTRDAMRCALEVLCNLCVHVGNRNAVLLHGGIDALVRCALVLARLEMRPVCGEALTSRHTNPPTRSSGVLTSTNGRHVCPHCPHCPHNPPCPPCPHCPHCPHNPHCPHCPHCLASTWTTISTFETCPCRFSTTLRCAPI